MFNSLDLLAATGALPSSAYLGMSVANGSFDAVAYSMAVAHEEEEDRKENEEEKERGNEE